MSIGAGIDNQRRTPAPRFLNLTDQLAFVIGLKGLYFNSQFAAERHQVSIDIGKRCTAVNLGLAQAQHV